MVGGEFRGEHDLVAVLAQGEPFAEPFFHLAILVVVCGVDEVATEGVVEVEDLEGGFFGSFAHVLIPECISR